MLRKSLIALSAAAALAIALAPAAQAKTNINVDLNLGFGGFGPVYTDYGPYYDDCDYKWVAYKKWNKWHTAYKIKHKKVLVCG
jgi:hypothetical protein